MNRRIPFALTLATCGLIGLANTLGTESQGRRAAVAGNGILDVIVDEETGNRLSGAVVTVPGYRSTTGLGGSCRFGLAPGHYSVVVSKAGYHSRTVKTNVRAGETTTARVRLRKLSRTRRR